MIWDANTGVTIRTIMFHKKGISQVAFSANGELVISVGMDDDRLVAIHNIRTGQKLGTGKVGKGIDLYDLAIGTDGSFVTGGKNHVKFWDIPAAGASSGELSSKGGIFGKNVHSKTVVSIAYLGVDPVTGMSDGSIILWKSRTSAKIENAHAGAVTAMCSLVQRTAPGSNSAASADADPRIITGGKDGKVLIWNMQLQSLFEFDLCDSTPTSTLPQIQSLAYREGRIVLGTKASELYELDTVTKELHRLAEGHYSERAEVIHFLQ